MALYFAYGSNLSAPDWRRWCEARGHEHRGLTYLRPARLDGWSLEFSIRSPSRGGGVLNVRQAPGCTAWGGLFEVDESGWRALDAKEGVPTLYERRMVRVVCTQNLEHEVVTYVAAPGVGQELIRPVDAYVELVRRALHEKGIDARGLETASAEGYARGR